MKVYVVHKDYGYDGISDPVEAFSSVKALLREYPKALESSNLDSPLHVGAYCYFEVELKED